MTPTKEMVEAASRVIATSQGWDWDKLFDIYKGSIRETATAALTAAFARCEVVMDCRDRDGFSIAGTLGVTVPLNSGDMLVIFRKGEA